MTRIKCAHAQSDFDQEPTPAIVYHRNLKFEVWYFQLLQFLRKNKSKLSRKLKLQELLAPKRLEINKKFLHQSLFRLKITIDRLTNFKNLRNIQFVNFAPKLRHLVNFPGYTNIYKIQISTRGINAESLIKIVRAIFE